MPIQFKCDICDAVIVAPQMRIRTQEARIVFMVDCPAGWVAVQTPRNLLVGCSDAHFSERFGQITDDGEKQLIIKAIELRDKL